MWKPLQKLKLSNLGPAPQKMVMSPALTPVSTGVFRGGLHIPTLKIQASKVKIQERKGKILREKRVEYHAFISYGPLTKRHNNRYASACNGEERVVMEALVSHRPLTERNRYASACNVE